MAIDFSDIKDERTLGKTPLDCAKKVELRMLRIFDRICKAHNLRYCLAWGTLLGAVRHKGFIPWDDDVDVHMPLEDWQRFVKIAKSELPEEMGLYYGAETQCGFGKLVDKKSFYLDNSASIDGGTMPRGIFLDIFPVGRYRNRFLLVGLAGVVRHAILSASPYGRLTLSTLLRKWFWHSILICVFTPLEYLNRSKNGRWTGVPYRMFGAPIVFSGSLFPATSVEFEGFVFPAPADVDDYLTRRYGAYMTLPPKDQRFSHAQLIVPLVKPVDEEF